MQPPLLVLTNVPDRDRGRSIARALVEQRLAACVNMIEGVRSVYRWQGAIEETTEVTLLIKTTEARYPDLEVAIRSLHPYGVPEIVGFPLVAGLPAYLSWLDTETKRDLDA